MLSSGNNLSRGNTNSISPDVPPLPQCLPLESITLGNQKYTRSGELRRVLGVPLGSTSEDHSFGIGHLKPPPPVATEELKNFKDSVQDASRKARDRVKMFHESIFKLDKYREALSSKKRQRIELLSNERSGRANLSKIGSQILRNPRDHATQKLEDKTKPVGLVLKKRIRTSMTDVIRADGRSTVVSRQQTVMEKEKDMLKAGSVGTIQIEEKIRRLSAGGEGWDRKMKRKRSIGAVGNRSINGDRDIKQAMHLKTSADAKLRSSDAQGFRSRSSPGMTGIDKLEESFEPANPNSSISLRNQLERVPSLRDRATISEERVGAKGNNKLNIHEENLAGSLGTMTKVKVSRASRSGSIMTVDSSPDVHPSSGTLEDWEQPTSGNKVPVLGVANNHKRPMTIGSSAPTMTQWAGQRPHKILRTRRANLVSPVSNNDEAQISSQGNKTSNITSRISSHGTGELLLASCSGNVNPKLKMKLENVSSPVGLSEGEESGGRQNKLKEEGADTGEAAGQGRIGRFFPSTKPAVTPMREKLENLPRTRPLQNMRRGSDKNKSKSGRPPMKKLTDRKTSSRAGHMLNSGSADFTGESDDDREQLLAAAKSARNASYLACSGPFWKKMEYIFASVSSQDASCLKQQLSLAEELNESLSQMFGDGYNTMSVLMHKEVPGCSDGRRESCSNQEPDKSDAFCGAFDMGRRLDKVPPLYQRVLSALIEEDESEEFYHQNEGRNMSFQCASDDSHCGSCNHIDVELKDRDRMESEVESEVDLQTQKHCLLDRFSCNKSASSNTHSNRSVSSSLCNNEQWQADDGLSCSDAGLLTGIYQNDLGVPHSSQINVSGISSCQYQMMCLDDRLLLELQSIGLYPETMPDLSEGEERINQDILKLQEDLYQQVGKLKKNLGKIDKAIEYGRDEERRNIDRVVMDQLVEMAYKKRMACRGNHSSKSVVRRVSKQVALAFVKRTLARCRKFEDTGRSCFSDAALQDVIFSVPSCNNEAKSVDCVGPRTASYRYNEACNPQAEAGGSATVAVSSTLERHDTYSDNLDRGSSDARLAISHPSEQAFSKHEAILSKGKKRELLLDDVVGSPSSKATTVIGCTHVGGVKGKRNERERDQNRDILTSNFVSGAGRSALASSRSERKSKAKPKQKTNHLSTPGNEFQGRFMEAMHPGRSAVHGLSQSVSAVSSKVTEEVGLPSPVNIARDSSKVAEEPADFANLRPNELDFMELNAPNELDSLLNFDDVVDDDGLQDHLSKGLSTPMDNLSDLFWS
ncbi:hypothetical protein F0562_022250 [Nyssa sinensis]|uniref:Uncharacterized protein n=1 Tax=Nyssa sinensis TaxID=561372 RepID=A0A5J5BN99_9ASTE|nr:hypothetical protein F0562_022250 [Nyssa sinensis]